MWQILELRGFDMRLSNSVPAEILKRYEKWKDIARISGPKGLGRIKGFRDESLPGQWKGHRASRLEQQWRVIYRSRKDMFIIEVVEVNPHDYRKK